MFDDENEINPQGLLIYKKGLKISEVVHRICKHFPDRD